MTKTFRAMTLFLRSQTSLIRLFRRNIGIVQLVSSGFSILTILVGVSFSQVPRLSNAAGFWKRIDRSKTPIGGNSNVSAESTGYAKNGWMHRELTNRSFPTDANKKHAGSQNTIVDDQSSLLPDLPGLVEGSAAWGDYDSDGRLDLIVSGNKTTEGGGFSRLYRNTGSGFDDRTSLLPNLPQLGSSAASWADYDNDGRLDLMISGGNHIQRISKLYHNTGSGFADQSSRIPGLPQVWNGSLAWADYDSDGRVDLLLTGRPLIATKPVSKLYRNTPDGFKDQSGLLPSLPGVQHSAVAWGDYDNDGQPDLLLTGYMGPGLGSVSKLYHNTGSGFDDQSIRLPDLPAVSDGSVAWGDYDNDGRLDLILTGGGATVPVSKLYHNTGNGFEDQSSRLPDLPGVRYGTVGWGDYDNDGWLDLLLTGDSGSELVTRLYHNTGTGFESMALPDTGIPNLSVSAAAFGDYDNDGRLDLLVTGYSSAGPVSRLFHNLSPSANTVPTAPTSLSSQVVSGGQGVKLNWQAATDAQTPKSGLVYNLYLSDTPDGQNLLSPMADQKVGYRRVVRLGNSQSTRFTMTGLMPNKTYYWSVQAIDGAFAGSPFAPEQSFTTSLSGGAEQALQLVAPLYDCQTGAFTFQTTGGDNSFIEYMAPGITAWTSNPNQFVDQGLRQAADAQPITLVARQNNQEVRYVWDIRLVCPVGDPNQLRLVAPLYDCQSGAFTFQTTGGDGSGSSAVPIEYMAAGITAWTKSPNHLLDDGLRTSADVKPLELRARQGNREVRYVWDIRAICPATTTQSRTRAAASLEPGNKLTATVHPNPVESDLTVRIQGAQDQLVSLLIVDLSGQVLVDRKIEVGQADHQERLQLGHLPAGLYLLRINTAQEPLRLKVIKQ